MLNLLIDEVLIDVRVQRRDVAVYLAFKLVELVAIFGAHRLALDHGGENVFVGPIWSDFDAEVLGAGAHLRRLVRMISLGRRTQFGDLLRRRLMAIGRDDPGQPHFGVTTAGVGQGAVHLGFGMVNFFPTGLAIDHVVHRLEVVAAPASRALARGFDAVGPTEPALLLEPCPHFIRRKTGAAEQRPILVHDLLQICRASNFVAGIVRQSNAAELSNGLEKAAALNISGNVGPRRSNVGSGTL